MGNVAEFLTCDTLGIELVSKENQVWGAGTKTFPFLNWKLDVWVQATSDIVEVKRCSMWVSLTKRLWLYTIVGSKNSYILIFDAMDLGITFDTTANFGGVSIIETLTQIKPFVKAIFKYDLGKEVWQKCKLAEVNKLIETNVNWIATKENLTN